MRPWPGKLKKVAGKTSEFRDVIGLEVIFQTNSLNGGVLVAFGNTPLDTRARNAVLRMLRGKRKSEE